MKNNHFMNKLFGFSIFLLLLTVVCAFGVGAVAYTDDAAAIEAGAVARIGEEGTGAYYASLTDSRSLLSYPRHHYFRRILCDYLGRMMENGLMTTELALVGELIRDICYRNACRYFKL